MNPSREKPSLPPSPRPRLVGIGELLWDVFPDGHRMGGAPANFACHAGALGADAAVVSRVGNDVAGRDLVAALASRGVDVSGIEVAPDAPTGTVTVELAPDGQPRYVIHENVAWDFLAGDPAGRAVVSAADAVCFGALAQRGDTARAAIRSLVAATRPGALRVFDVNLRQHYFSGRILEESLGTANVLKLNDAELPVLARLLGLPGEVRAGLAELALRYRLRLVAYTRGGSGSVLHADGRWSDHPGVPTRVVDTVGAGDSFTAAMTLGWLAGWNLDRVNDVANRVASHVCSCPGATPPLPAALVAEFAGMATPPQP